MTLRLREGDIPGVLAAATATDAACRDGEEPSHNGIATTRLRRCHAVHQTMTTRLIQHGGAIPPGFPVLSACTGEKHMKHGRGGNQAPGDRQQQYAPQRHGQQYPADQPWQQPQYEPGLHAQRINGAQQQEYRQPLQPQQSGPGWQQYPQQVPPWQQTPPQAPPPQRRKRHIVRNALAGIGGLVVVIIVITVAASGGNHTVNTTGNSTTPTTGTGAGQSAKTTAKAAIGSSITLAGNTSAEQMAVTVTKVITDANPDTDFDSAPAGDRLYAVQFRLADTGSAAYSDSPSNGAAVVDSNGQSYESGVETVAGCQSFPSTENIAPDASGLGCIVFEVPKAAKIAEVQFTLDSGFGPQTGQWDVAGQN
jgi:hypothetical protein